MKNKKFEKKSWCAFETTEKRIVDKFDALFKRIEIETKPTLYNEATGFYLLLFYSTSSTADLVFELAKAELDK